MKPVHQTLFRADQADTEGDDFQRGNCLQAAIASVFELPLEDVPHFVGHEDWWGELERWLRGRNIAVMWLPREQFANATMHAPWGAFMLATGKSPRGDYKHVVVWHDFEMAHDPHPSGDGLDGDPEGFYYFIVADPAKQEAA